MRNRVLWLVLLIMLTIAACGPTSIEQQTLTAFDSELNTARADLFATGTVRAERVQITLEYVSEQISVVGTQGGLMQATLQARGVDIRNSPQPISPTPPPADATQAPTRDTVVDVVAGPQPTANPNSTPTPVQITPFQSPTPSPLPTREAPVVVVDVPQLLNDIVLDSQVGDDDCAVSPTTQFAPQTQEIYIIARALELPAGTTITTRWFRGDEQLVQYDFTYEFIEDACIWFFSDQTNFEFTPGQYSIELDINGLPFGEPIPFTIVDPTAG